MAQRQKSRFWRRCRIYFRRFRILIWSIVLLVLAALIYVNQVGLPGFIKKPLLEKLHARGIDLQFSRLRWRWYQGIVAENVQFGKADQASSPQLRLREVQVQLNHNALRHFQLQVDSLILRQGHLVWPFLGTNNEPRQLEVENIQTDLHLLPEDKWELDDFMAGFAGAKIRLSGAVTNASKVREWPFPQGKQGAGGPHPGLWRDRLRALADTLERVHFSEPPELDLNIRGDALNLQSFQVRLMISTPGAQTPWGEFSEGRFIGRILPPSSNGTSRAEISLEAADARTRWGNCSALALSLRATSVEGETNLLKGNLKLLASHIETRWATVEGASFTAEWLHALTNAIPLEGKGELITATVMSKWGNLKDLRLTGNLRTPPSELLPAKDNSWAAWNEIQPYFLDVQASIGELESTGLKAEKIVCGGNWQVPQLTVTNLHATLYQGELSANANLDIATRQLKASLTSDVDPHKIEAVLTQGARDWLQQFSWNSAPKLQGQIAVILPPWNEQEPNWRAEVQPTLLIDGGFQLAGGGAYRGVPVSTAESHLNYSNMVWSLPDLKATRPEGVLEAAHVSDDKSKNFFWRIHSTMPPDIIRPLLSTNEAHALDFMTFSQPPKIDAEIRGRWHKPEELGAKGSLALTNFAFRGQRADYITAAFEYTNLTVKVINPRAEVGTQQVSAASLLVDIPARKIYLSNGFGFIDPQVITRAIGPHVHQIIEPYQFLKPPIAHVNGVIPMKDETDADLFFEIDGGPFHWWKFNLSHVVGSIHWAGERLTLNNIRIQAYGGNAVGSALFRFKPHAGTIFQFDVSTTNMLLQALMGDLATRTNRLEGTLDSLLVVTRGNTDNWQNLDGYGDVNLHDGLIWDIPIFGVFSKVLNEVAPGLGNSRANAGAGDFAITNGVIRTDNLEIRSHAVRLQYRGTVDLDERVNARVEAELLRDVWAVGPLISTVLWPVTKMFEYRVTGTLGQPKTDPVYLIPKIMLMPFHPIRTLKDLVPQNPNASFGTNSPPKTVK